MDSCETYIDEKIELGQSLVTKLEADFAGIDGALKTKRNIEKEIKFLVKLKSKDSDDIRRKLQCTNLNFFNHLVDSLYNYEVKNISYAVRGDCDKPIRVDIVAREYESTLWVKIIARNSESIIDGVLGRCEYGSKDILSVADEFLETAQSKVNFFKQPKVVFDFLNPIDERLEAALEEKGIIIGRKYRESRTTAHCEENPMDTILNLDITAMLAYVSELSNGGTGFTFKDRLIEEQKEAERKKPVKAILNKLFDNKTLICCETAMKSFDEIIELLGGENEKVRAADLRNRIKVLPDVPNPEEIIPVDLSSQIKERSRKIFSFGVHHKAITISSNMSFKRAAKMKNFEVPMIKIEARALTERKQEN